jgi:hypothetical protein
MLEHRVILLHKNIVNYKITTRRIESDMFPLW